METQTITQVYKYRKLSNDPQYFGCYLNMACLNVLNISNHIARELGLSLPGEDGQLKNSFLCNKDNKNVNWHASYSKTRHYLPIIKIFDVESLPKAEQKRIDSEGKDFTLMSNSLKVVFGELQEFRNDYQYYYPTEKKDLRKTSVSDELALFLQTNFRRALEYTREKFNGVLNDVDYQFITSKKVLNADQTITTEGLVFLTSMFLEREYAFRFIEKISDLRGTQNNSFVATREVLMAFCLKLPQSKFQRDNPKQAFSLDLINELNKCPLALYNVIPEKAKQNFRSQLNKLVIKSNHFNSLINEIESDDYDNYTEALKNRIRYNNRFTGFALKFIDEMEIFSKIRFQIDLGKLLVDEYDKSFNGELVPRKIVENPKAFGKLNAFGAEDKVLSQIKNDFITQGFEQFDPHYNTENNRIGLSTNETIAKLMPNSKGEPGKKLRQPLPEAFLSLHELPKIILLNYLKKGEPEKLITEYIHLNNSKLMDRSFIEEVKSQLPQQWDEFKRRSDTKKEMAYNKETLDDLLERKKTLNRILAAYQLDDKQIPGRILDYWLNIANEEEEKTVSDHIKSIKRDCMSRLKALRKFEKDGNRNNIPGNDEMAAFISQDIIDMVVSESKKQKITSFYFDKMQECLAHYADPEKKRIFIRIVTKELRLYETGGHPFLYKLNLQLISYTSEFYQLYLEEKGHNLVTEKNPKTGKVVETDHSWMATTFYKSEWSEKVSKLMTVVKLPLSKLNIPLTLRHLEGKTISSLEQWIHHLSQGKHPGEGKHPVNLPTNLFDKKLTDLLQKELDHKHIIYRPYANWNELFKIWAESRSMGIQSFYNAEREYHIFDEKVNFFLNRKDNFACYYTSALKAAYEKKRTERRIKQLLDSHLPDILFEQVEKVFKHTICETEKEIRMLQEEDRILLIMLEGLLEDGNKLQLKLSEIKTLLNENIDEKQSVHGILSIYEPGDQMNNKNKREIVRTVSVTRKRNDNNTPGEIVSDGRLPELFEYFPPGEIQLESLKEELKEYDNVRHVVSDLSFKLEKVIISKGRKDPIKQLYAGESGELQTGNIPHSNYLTWLKNNGMIDDNTLIFMKMIHNCFSNNRYPRKKTMERLIHNWESDRFAFTIVKTYNQKIAGILQNL